MLTRGKGEKKERGEGGRYDNTYAPSRAGADVVGQAVDVGRGSHQDDGLDLVDGCARDGHGCVGDALVGIAASAEGVVEDFGTLNESPGGRGEVSATTIIRFLIPFSSSRRDAKAKLPSCQIHKLGLTVSVGYAHELPPSKIKTSRTWEYPTKTSSVDGHSTLKALTALAAAAVPCCTELE